MSKLITLLAYTAIAAAVAVQAPSSTCTPGSVTSNGRQCTTVCGIDHPGGDYSSNYVPDFQSCINACTADSTCQTAQYSISNSYCYLKSNINPSKSNVNVNSIVCRTPPRTPSLDTCTSKSVTINGRSGALQCGYDYPGGDYASQYSGSFGACQNSCAADSKCLTAQYDSVTKYCYLKNSLNTAVSKSSVYSIIFPPASSPAGCMPYAPTSPFLLSSGFEQGTQDWQLTPSAGLFNGYLTSGVALEGCKAYVVSPLTSNNTSKLRSVNNKVLFHGLSRSRTYNVSIKVGSLSSSLIPGPAPCVQILAGGKKVVQHTSICGWTKTHACPIRGVGNATGQVLSGQFTWTGSEPAVDIEMFWPIGSGNNPVLLDDVEIRLA